MVQGDDLPLAGDEVLIFHPHGFLPRGMYSRDFSKEPRILSEDDYQASQSTKTTEMVEGVDVFPKAC